MSETINQIPFSSIRRKIRKELSRPQSAGASFPPVDFLPCDLKIWTGHDSDFFHQAFCHHRMILKIILAGKATTSIDGIRYRLLPSDAVLYFPMQTHSTETEDDGIFEYLAISFVAGIGRYEALNALKNRVFSPDPENRFLLELIRAWKENRTSHAVYLLAELLSSAAASVSGENPESGGRFAGIAEYIRKNCNETLSVKKIASEFRISPQSVRRIFRENITGLTPGELIRQQRMIRAEDLRRRTDLPLAEIAEKCGFANAFSFSRSFRREHGIPPAAYRKQQIR